MNHKYVFLIPARGGSKGLPRKNVLPIAGIPLIGWTIKASRILKALGPTFVTSDDSEIISISKSLNSNIIVRPDELADDNASSSDVVLHAIEWFEQNEIFCENIVLLQPTSPLRTSNHILEAISVFEGKSASMVLSVYEPELSIVKAYIAHKDGSIRGVYNDNAPYCRRQDLPSAFLPNGAIYIFSVSNFKARKSFPIDNVHPYIMDAEDSDDLDDMNDFKNIERKINARIER